MAVRENRLYGKKKKKKMAKRLQRKWWHLILMEFFVILRIVINKYQKEAYFGVYKAKSFPLYFMVKIF